MPPAGEVSQTAASMPNNLRPELSGKTPEMWRKSARRGFLKDVARPQKSVTARSNSLQMYQGTFVL
jgi:hypothetical protein